MNPPEADEPSIFETTPVAPDDPLLKRPLSSVPLERIAEAARIVMAYPEAPAIQRYRKQIATLRITPEEIDDLLAQHARLRVTEIGRAPRRLHKS